MVRIFKKGKDVVIRWKERSKTFTLEWYKEFDWTNNPFNTTIPHPPDEFIAGYEKERKKLNLFLLENYKSCFIEGEEGTGKTMLLRWIEHELRNYKDRVMSYFIDQDSKLTSKRKLIKMLVYPLLDSHEKLMYNMLFRFRFRPLENLRRKIAQTDKSIFVERLFSEDLVPAADILRKRLGNKKIVIIIDGLFNTTPEVWKTLSYFLQQDLAFQVVCADDPKNFDKAKLDDLGIKPTIQLKVNTLSLDDTKDLIRKRIRAVRGEGIDPFSDVQFKKIYESSDKTPKGILKTFHLAAVKQALNELAKKMKEDEQEIAAPAEPEPSFKGIPAVEKGESAVTIEQKKEKGLFHIPEPVQDAVEKLSKEIKARDRREHHQREKTKEERETEKIVMNLADELEKEHKKHHKKH